MVPISDSPLVWPKTPDCSLGDWDARRQTKPTEAARDVGQGDTRPCTRCPLLVVGSWTVQPSRPWERRERRVRRETRGMREEAESGPGPPAASSALSRALGRLSIRVIAFGVYVDPLPNPSSVKSKIKNPLPALSCSELSKHRNTGTSSPRFKKYGFFEREPRPSSQREPYGGRPQKALHRLAGSNRVQKLLAA